VSALVEPNCPYFVVRTRLWTTRLLTNPNWLPRRSCHARHPCRVTRGLRGRRSHCRAARRCAGSSDLSTGTVHPATAGAAATDPSRRPLVRVVSLPRSSARDSSWCAVAALVASGRPPRLSSAPPFSSDASSARSARGLTSPAKGSEPVDERSVSVDVEVRPALGLSASVNDFAPKELADGFSGISAGADGCFDSPESLDGWRSLRL
jgi:hypothetical protein